MIRINLLGVEKRSTKTATFDFDVGQMVTVACSLVMVVTVVVLGWWYWSLRNESLQLDDELAAGRQEVTRLQAFGDEYSGARRPDWPGATTENIE
ncbi:MAG: hypothetical protein O2930_01125, partial [Acidobacteria bacterium]|nr:hypothetical protein [Acidobacteriota bacterium]